MNTTPITETHTHRHNMYTKFPVERKNEFLKYIMITEPCDEWSDVVFGYIIENNIKDWKEGFDFVIKNSSDPPWVAYGIVTYGYAEPEWAMKAIESATIGDPSMYSYNMVSDGHAEPEWARKVIENTTTGDPSLVAYFMVKDGHAKPEWAKEVIKNATSGDPSWVAYHMVRCGYATQEWYRYQEIRRKNSVLR